MTLKLLLPCLFILTACVDASHNDTTHAPAPINNDMSTTANIEKYYIDHLAIRQLIDHYTDIVNHRTWQDIGEIFATTAVWEAPDPINLKWSGLEDIRQKLPASVARMEVLIQTASGIVVEVESDTTASVRSILNEFGRNKETKQGMHSVGTYEDLVTKENGTWKFLSRKLTLLYNDTLPVPGNIKDYKY